jgi:mono/diheme cytochrome c family protein
MKRWWAPLIILAASCASSHAAEKSPANIEVFFKQHCYTCHDAGQEGDLNLEGRAWTFNGGNSFEFWKKLYFAVKDERKPPE